MENSPNREVVLPPGEESMYQTFVRRNPGITRADFLELRGLAQQTKNPRIGQFYEMNGLIMQEKPTREEMNEMTPDNLKQE